MASTNNATRLLRRPSRGEDAEDGNILVLGIGAWLVILALAFAMMAVADLYSDKRDAAAEADYIALSLADDVNEASYYADAESTLRVSDEELLRRARELARYDSDIVQASSLPDGSVHIQLKRTVSVFVIPALTDVGNVEIYASSTAHLRDYHSP